MLWIRCHVTPDAGLKNFLQSALAPYALCDAKYCVLLGCPNGSPFLDQGRIQLFKFLRIFSRKNRCFGKRPCFSAFGGLLRLSMNTTLFETRSRGSYPRA